jgi:hypothetical protein
MNANCTFILLTCCLYAEEDNDTTEVCVELALELMEDRLTELALSLTSATLCIPKSWLGSGKEPRREEAADADVAELQELLSSANLMWRSHLLATAHRPSSTSSLPLPGPSPLEQGMLKDNLVHSTGELRLCFNLNAQLHTTLDTSESLPSQLQEDNAIDGELPPNLSRDRRSNDDDDEPGPPGQQCRAGMHRGLAWPLTPRNMLARVTCSQNPAQQATRLCCGAEKVGYTDDNGKLCKQSQYGRWMTANLTACTSPAVAQLLATVANISSPAGHVTAAATTLGATNANASAAAASFGTDDLRTIHAIVTSAVANITSTWPSASTMPASAVSNLSFVLAYYSLKPQRMLRAVQANTSILSLARLSDRQTNMALALAAQSSTSETLNFTAGLGFQSIARRVNRTASPSVHLSIGPAMTASLSLGSVNQSRCPGSMCTVAVSATDTAALFVSETVSAVASSVLGVKVLDPSAPPTADMPLATPDSTTPLITLQLGLRCDDDCLLALDTLLASVLGVNEIDVGSNTSISFLNNGTVAVSYSLLSCNDFSGECIEQPRRLHAGQLACAWWDFDISDWSTTGCTLLSGQSSGGAPSTNSSGSNATVTCQCTHLTNFAVLVSLESPESSSTASGTAAGALSALTLLGCSLSIVCLSCIVAVLLVVSRTKVSRMHHFILLQLCLALLA